MNFLERLDSWAYIHEKERWKQVLKALEAHAKLKFDIHEFTKGTAEYYPYLGPIDVTVNSGETR